MIVRGSERMLVQGITGRQGTFWTTRMQEYGSRIVAGVNPKKAGETHCDVPVCSASRASVMSGVAATTHGSYELGPKYEELPPLTDVPTMQGYFKDNGYYTLSGGKVLHHGFNGRLAGDIDRSLGRKKSPTPKKPLNRPAHWSGAWDWGPFPETDAEMGE